MKKIIASISLTFFHFHLFAQLNVNAQTFFNDSLKGKWIFEKHAVFEAGYEDYTNSGIDFIVFEKLNSQNIIFLNRYTNGKFENDSVRLYSPELTIIGKAWTMDNFLFYRDVKLIIGTNKYNLCLLQDNFFGIANFYNKDTTYTKIPTVQNQTGISIYPTVTSGIITIENGYNDLVVINMYNNVGAHIKSKKIDSNSTDILDLIDLERGCYYLIIQNKRINLTQSIIRK
jgi:hypothetical protein